MIKQWLGGKCVRAAVCVCVLRQCAAANRNGWQLHFSSYMLQYRWEFRCGANTALFQSASPLFYEPNFCGNSSQIPPDCSINTCLSFDGANASSFGGCRGIFSLLFLTRSGCCLCLAGCFVSIKPQRRGGLHMKQQGGTHPGLTCRCPRRADRSSLNAHITVNPPPPTSSSCAAPPFLCGTVTKTSLPTWLCTPAVLQHYIISRNNVSNDVAIATKTLKSDVRRPSNSYYEYLMFCNLSSLPLRHPGGGKSSYTRL